MVGYKYKSMIITRVGLPPNNTESSNAAVANKVTKDELLLRTTSIDYSLYAGL